MSDRPEPRFGPLSICAGWWIVGVLLGHGLPELALWLTAASAITLGCIWLLATDRGRAARTWGVVGLMTVAAAWTVVRAHHIPLDHIRHHLDSEPQLVEVVGLVETPPRLSTTNRGAFSSFDYRSPVTVFTLRLEQLRIGGRMQPVRGKLLVRIAEPEHALRGGERIAASGWMATIHTPMNPGEIDFAEIFRRRAIDGRLSLRDRGNWRRIDPVPSDAAWSTWRHTVSTRASAALHAGMTSPPERTALLDAILLGRTSEELREIYTSFRNTGLAHLLSISGAHLGILLGMVWILARLAMPHPSRAAMMVLVILGIYLMAVPMRTPIVRAGIMAGLFALVQMTGRRTRAIDILAIAAVTVLIWRPADLFNAGFQLSFLAVAALILFTRAVSERIDPQQTIPGEPIRHGINHWLRRHGVDLLAASIVASITVLPLVAYHFQLITPLAIGYSLLALPFVAAVLALGYLKMILSLLTPSIGYMVGPPLAVCSDALLAGVTNTASWQGSSIHLPRAPSLVWTIATTLLAVALFTGCFAGRKRMLAMAVLLCAGWLALEVKPQWANRLDPTHRHPAMTVKMIAVGHGSCYIVRAFGADDAGRPLKHTLMIDCGSHNYFNVAEASVIPAMGHHGIDRIDSLVITHGHFDHFNGVLDLLDNITVSRILLPHHLLEGAAARPDGPAAFLMRELHRRRVPVIPIAQGWTEQHGDLELQALWPPSDFHDGRLNNQSLVLSIRTPGGRALLCGDIEHTAMTALLQSGIDLRADICNVPHHGGMEVAAPAFLTAVTPRIAIQSSSTQQLRRDQWQPFFDQTDVPRLITARSGMVRIELDRDGTLTWSTFRND